MKTAGHFLRLARNEKSLTIEQLSSLTKIDTKYIEAIESDDYEKLPSETFIKGFIRNLSIRLDLNPDEMVAVFRRDFKSPKQDDPKPIRAKKINSFSTFTSSPLLITTLAIGVFILYLVFQFRAILTPPNLEIVRPSENSVLVSPVEIEGVTSVDSKITINKEVQIKPDLSGHFIGRLTLPVGETDIQITSTNRFGRSQSKKLHLTIVTQ